MDLSANDCKPHTQIFNGWAGMKSGVEIPILYTAQQVSDLLCVTQRTLAQWRMDGSGPRYGKFGKKILYPENFLAEYIEKNLKSCTAEYHIGPTKS